MPDVFRVFENRPLCCFALCAVMQAASGCASTDSPQGAAGREAVSMLDRRVSPGLEMRVLLSQDTIDAGAPIEVLYAVVNGPAPTPLLNNPSLFGVLVETEDGQLAPVSSSSSASASPGDQVRMMLPAGAILVQREDLRCVRGAGYAPPAQDSGDCGIVYQLKPSTRYRVIVRYNAPPTGPYAHPVIADTALLVVR